MNGSSLLISLALLQLCRGIQVYIDTPDLERYFTDTPHFTKVQGRRAIIIATGHPQTDPNGSLYLSSPNGSREGLLPALPRNVSTLSITWSTNDSQVQYHLSTSEDPVGFFAAASPETILNIPETGVLPTQKTTFTLDVTCAMLTGEGDLSVALTTTSDNNTLETTFIITKDCGTIDSQGSGDGIAELNPLLSTSAMFSFTPVLATTQVMVSSSQVLVELLISTPVPSEVLTSTPVVVMSTPTLLEPFSSAAILFETLSTTPVFFEPFSSTPEVITSTHTFSPAPTTMPSEAQTTTLRAIISTPELLQPFSSPTVLSEQLTTTPLLFEALTTTPVLLEPLMSSSAQTLLVNSISSYSTTPVFTQILTPSTSLPSTLTLSTLIVTITPSTTFSSSSVLIASSLAPSSSISSPITLSLLASSTPTPSHSPSTLASTTLSVVTNPTSPTSQFSSVASPKPLSMSTPSPPPSIRSSSAIQAIPPTPLLTASPIGVPTTQSSVVLMTTSIPTNVKEPELTLLLVIVFAPIVAVLLLCIILILCFIACVCLRRKKTNSKSFSDDPADLPIPIIDSNLLPGVTDLEDTTKKTEAPISLWMSLPWGAVSTLPNMIQGVIQSYTVDRRSLSVLSTSPVCRGEYGCIVNGQLTLDRTDLLYGHKGVMMKMLIGFKQSTGGHHNEITKFLEQATLFRGLDHPNITMVMRVSVEDNLIPLVLYPIVEYGNLHTFLTLCRVSPNESPLNPITLQHKVNFGLQIAYAMKYLCENGVVHPDLALRNCFLDTNYLVKVGDGALSRDLFPDCYYVIKGAVRPVRWAAPETFAEGLCTSHSNVWSYAVTLWEILTKAEFPYKEVDNNRSIPSHLMMGARLEQPPDCPDYLYEMIQACWDEKAERRPNFTDLHSQMERINEQLATVEDDSPSMARQLYSRENSRASLDRMASHQSRHKRSGRSSFPKSSPSVIHRNTNSRVSAAGSENLSLTFSVLSGDNLSSGSPSENDEDPEGLSPLAESVVYQMMPSLLRDDNDNKMEQSSGDIEHLPTSSPINLVTSFLDSSSDQNTIELESSSKYTPIPSMLISPAPTTPSTITTHLTSCETTSSYASSQFGPSTTKSDDSVSTALPASTPSPDLTSKSSMFGEESNPRLSYISHSNVDTTSKTSISESIGPSTPGLEGYSRPPNGHTPNIYAHSNGQLPVNGTILNHNQERTDEVADSTGVKTSSIRDYESVNSVENTSVKAQTSSEANRTSLGLGLSDLSSDLMATFDSWKL